MELTPYAIACLSFFFGYLFKSWQKDKFSSLEKEKQMIELALKNKTKFLSVMSHEVRTPINGILGLSELLRDSLTEEENIKLVELIQSSAHSLLNLLNDMLDFAKLEAGKIELESTPVNIHEEIDKVVALLQISAKKNNSQLLYEAGSDIPSQLISDPTRLKQVITNLASNAIKFSKNAEVKIISKLKEKESNEYIIQIDVIDKGIGIPKKLQNKLFQSFSQVDASIAREYGGTGLGLSICKGIVEAMNGNIWFESQEGIGSTFSFTFVAKAV